MHFSAARERASVPEPHSRGDATRANVWVVMAYRVRCSDLGRIRVQSMAGASLKRLVDGKKEPRPKPGFLIMCLRLPGTCSASVTFAERLGTDREP